METVLEKPSEAKHVMTEIKNEEKFMTKCTQLSTTVLTITNAIHKFYDATANFCTSLEKEYGHRVKSPLSATLKAHLRLVKMLANEAAPKYYVLANRLAHWVKIHIPETRKITEQQSRLLTGEDKIILKLDFILEHLKNYNEMAVPLNFRK